MDIRKVNCKGFFLFLHTLFTGKLIKSLIIKKLRGIGFEISMISAGMVIRGHLTTVTNFVFEQ
jgi:hypothetical protein